jgi:TonB family protein
MKLSILCITLIAACALCLISCATGHKTNSLTPNETTNSNSSLNDEEIAPELIKNAQPVYPPKALDSSVTAVVVIKAFVDTLGIVKKASVVKCSRPGQGFEEAAIKAAYECRYKPAWQKGRKVGVWVQYNMNFTLNRE